MSQTISNPRTMFQLADEDKWDAYIKHRPGYPDSVFQRWLEFHGEANKLESIHDVGTGGGVGAMAFLRALPRLRSGEIPIKTYHLSDPGAANLNAARRNLSPAHFPGINFTFHPGPAEEPNPNVAPGTLDMVTACECLHWTDIEPTMRNIAASLRPGGTFAVVQYHAIPRIISNAAARQAQLDVERLWRRVNKQRRGPWNIKLRMQSANGLDFVPMDGEVWEDVVRWYCNVRNRAWAFDEFLTGLDEGEVQANRPRTYADFGPGREREEVVEQDWVGWGRRGVGVEVLRQSMAAYWPGSFDDIFETDEWRALEKAVEDGGGKCDVEIPALMIMGRKK